MVHYNNVCITGTKPVMNDICLVVMEGRVMCRVKRVMAVTTVLLAALLAGQCSTGDNASDIAGDLADRLTDALDFENGDTQEGSAPEGSSDAGAPQIVNLVAPTEMRMGEPFALELYTTFVTPADITGAIVAVRNAAKHISVSAVTVPVATQHVMYLTGVLTADSELMGKDFEITVALHTSAGATGMYVTWGVTVLNLQGAAGGNYVSSMDAGGGTWSDTGRPPASNADTVPQISTVEGPDQLRVGESFNISLVSANSAVRSGVTAIIATLPGSAGYKKITSFQTGERDGSMVYVVQGKLGIDAVVMRNMVVLWALQNNTGDTGVFVPWTAQVDTSSNTDGDEDIDAVAEGDIAVPMCVCGDPGVTLTAVSCTWSDAEECTGWTSACHENNLDETQAFADGTELTAWDCTIRINCP